jgi:GTPase SAR1 family protein
MVCVIMTVTGSIFPIGDGGVGKTALSKVMAEHKITSTKIECVDGLKKTVNMEFEFVSCVCQASDEAILLQMYVPPGQRRIDQSEDLGTFEKIMDTYSFMPNMQNISVILLVYKLSEFRTLAVLESWLETVLMNDLVKPFTSVVLIGTHLDITPFDVKPEQVTQAVDFIRSKIEAHISNWRGCVEQTYVSNVTGTGIQELKKELTELVCMAQHLKKGTKPDCDDACSMCMERKCSDSVSAI